MTGPHTPRLMQVLHGTARGAPRRHELGVDEARRVRGHHGDHRRAPQVDRTLASLPLLFYLNHDKN